MSNVEKRRNITKVHPGQTPFHIIESQQFTKEWLEQDLFPEADKWKAFLANREYRTSKPLAGKHLYYLFYESSTRTRTSFQRAIKLMGGDSEGTENARMFSSVTKGETLEDTVQVLDGYYYDFIVLRYDQIGGARRAARVAKTPIINAGDGTGQHPTQALLDVYTIDHEFGNVGDQVVTFIGDPQRGRTVHSATYLLAKFPKMKFNFVSPNELRIPVGLRNYLDRHEIPYNETSDLESVLQETDVAYVTRLQSERDKKKGKKIITPQDYTEFFLTPERADKLPAHAIIMHPLPRNNELPKTIDKNPRARYTQQAHNGLPIRMSLLNMIDLGRIY